jgi:hypothetical protein
MDTANAFLSQAKQRAERFGVRNVVVATLTGESVRLVREAFGPRYRFFAVGNPPPAHARGLVYHDGTDEETRHALEREGITVILRDQGPFQAINIGGPPYDVGGEVPHEIWRGAHKSIEDWSLLGRLDEVISKGLRGEINALWVISQTIASLLGDGPGVCLEIALMAADSGLLPLDQDCLAISRPRPASHAPDAALVLHPRPTPRLLAGLRIKDVLLVPRSDDHWFCDRPLWPDG